MQQRVDKKYYDYMPYGEALSDGYEQNTPAQPYKFSGKELDQETGYYYYGAKYYDPSTALWLGVDPLKHKYPGIGAYVYCAGNPVRYVDSDGRKPWDNKNIRWAESLAGTLGSGYSVKQTSGKYGQDAQVVYTDKSGTQTIVHDYPATQANQKSGILNFMDWIDNEAGQSDIANQGTCTKQDVFVATSIVGLGTGGISLVTASSVGAAIVAGIVIVNTIDEFGINERGESFSQQMVESQEAKEIIGNIKLTISVVGFINSGVTILNSDDLMSKVNEGVSIGSTVVNIFNSILSKE